MGEHLLRGAPAGLHCALHVPRSARRRVRGREEEACLRAEDTSLGAGRTVSCSVFRAPREGEGSNPVKTAEYGRMRLSKCPPERQLEYKNTYSDREAGPAAAVGGADDLARPRQRDVPGRRAGRLQPGGDEVDGAAAREAVLAPLPLEELDALGGARLQEQWRPLTATVEPTNKRI